MSTAATVPVTQGIELEGDEAVETLREVGLRNLIRRSFMRFRYADGFSHSRALAFQFILTLLPGLIALVGPSRVYLGHHWASDVLGGYALGTAYLLILIQLYRISRPGLEGPATTHPAADPLITPSRT